MKIFNAPIKPVDPKNPDGVALYSIAHTPADWRRIRRGLPKLIAKLPKPKKRI